MNALSKSEILHYMSLTSKDDLNALYAKAYDIKMKQRGNKIFLRGLIEYSNICRKNCLYCGIRSGNNGLERYALPRKEVLDAVHYAYENRYGSIVLQSGEQQNPAFISDIEALLVEIKKISQGKIGITLSLGEQTDETYSRWFKAGAHRYLLRIETSNRNLYAKIHPDDKLHSFDSRIEALSNLRKTGYIVGSGVMIGLPGQTLEDLANDIVFMLKSGFDMIGMGPYIEHLNAPLRNIKSGFSLEQRFELTLKMIAIMRICRPRMNIVASTALQVSNSSGWENGLKAGANIMMPNLTPASYRSQYSLYDGKACLKDNPVECHEYIVSRINSTGNEIGWDEWGDSRLEMQ